MRFYRKKTHQQFCIDMQNAGLEESVKHVITWDGYEGPACACMDQDLSRVRSATTLDTKVERLLMGHRWVIPHEKQKPSSLTKDRKTVLIPVKLRS